MLIYAFFVQVQFNTETHVAAYINYLLKYEYINRNLITNANY